jgi:hypothetical protein
VLEKVPKETQIVDKNPNKWSANVRSEKAYIESESHAWKKLDALEKNR